jgi:hypothetical protein
MLELSNKLLNAIINNPNMMDLTIITKMKLFKAFSIRFGWKEIILIIFKRIGTMKNEWQKYDILLLSLLFMIRIIEVIYCLTLILPYWENMSSKDFLNQTILISFDL